MDTASPPPKIERGQRVRVNRGLFSGLKGVLDRNSWYADIGILKMDDGREIPVHYRDMLPDPAPAESGLMMRLERGVGPPADVTPPVAAVASGAAIWQQADARNRHVFIHIHGHVASVTASASPTSDGYTAKFLGPFREAAVGPALDFVIANGDHEPFEFGGPMPLAEIGGGQ